MIIYQLCMTLFADMVLLGLMTAASAKVCTTANTAGTLSKDDFASSTSHMLLPS